MYRMTARNIALISPMRTNLFALSGASAFAAAIIEKYSGTESFPFAGETLIYFNAMRERLEEEKKRHGDVGYSLRLMILRRLIVDGRLGDPTVTKQLLPLVSERIEHTIDHLRISDGTSYSGVLKALSFIDNTEELNDTFYLSEIHEGERSYRVSSVDVAAVSRLFLNAAGESVFSAGNYTYNNYPRFVFKRELIESVSSAVSGDGGQVSVINAGDIERHYDTTDLTYKTEVSNTESADVKNVRNEQTNVNVSGDDTANISNVSNVSNVVANAGNVDNRYDTTDLTYKTEVSNSESADVKNVRNEQTNVNISGGDTANISNVSNVSNVVANAGNIDNHYDTTDLTYKTEVSNTESADVKNVRNEQTNVNVSGGDTTNISNVSNVVANAGNIDNHYVTTDLTYKTEVVDTPGESRNETDAAANKTIAELQKAGELKEIGLLVMNTFISRGAEYISEIRNKHIHKRISLVPVIASADESYASRLLNSSQTAFGVISYAVGLLTAERVPDPHERSIYESAVTQVYLERHDHTTNDIKSMFAAMSPGERTKVLTLIVDRLSGAEHELRPTATQTARRGSEPGKIPVSESETRLLKLLSADKQGRIVKLIHESAAGDTVSALLNKVYYGGSGAAGGAAGKDTEGTVSERVRNAVYMPEQLKHAELSRENAYSSFLMRLIDRNITVHTENESYSRNILDMRELRDSAQNVGAMGPRTHGDSVQSADARRGSSPEHGAVRHDTLRTLVGRTVAYERALKTLTSRTAAPGADRGDAVYNYSFNSAVSEYELPVTIMRSGAVEEGLRTLPGSVLERVILPGVRSGISVGRTSAADPETTQRRHHMTVRQDIRRLTFAEGSAASMPAVREEPAADTIPGIPVLNYREPGPAVQPASQVPSKAVTEAPQPSREELVKQFGNLIEGADAGMIPSFDVGTRGVGDAMAAIEQTAEKVAVNSRLIDEIREKQRIIEQTTLKASDIDALSEQMIRKLRDRMRLDRSRFSGQ